MYTLYFIKAAQKDAKVIAKSSLKEKIKQLLEILETDPFKNPSPYKKLKGSYSGAYSRRITLQHRLFYEVDEKGKRIKILKMWTHYGYN